MTKERTTIQAMLFLWTGMINLLSKMLTKFELALEVTLQDQEVMVALERENDPWLLKQWSSELIEERVAAAREAQEAGSNVPLKMLSG